MRSLGGPSLTHIPAPSQKKSNHGIVRAASLSTKICFVLWQVPCTSLPNPATPVRRAQPIVIPHRARPKGFLSWLFTRYKSLHLDFFVLLRLASCACMVHPTNPHPRPQCPTYILALQFLRDKPLHQDLFVLLQQVMRMLGAPSQTYNQAPASSGVCVQ